MESRRVHFNSDQMVEMAQFTSELIRQGVTWESYSRGEEGFDIILNGGY